MRDIIERTTDDSNIVELSNRIGDKNLILFLAKTQFTYPEYKHRLSVARANAISEAKVNKYSEAYTNAFVHYRIEMEKYTIYKDMLSAFELLTAKLIFKNPLVLRTPEFVKLEKDMKSIRVTGAYLEDC